jgi:hypothetical protein
VTWLPTHITTINSYEIYTASSADFRYVEVDKSHVDFEPGTLPPLNHNYSNIVDAALYNRWSKDTSFRPIR